MKHRGNLKRPANQPRGSDPLRTLVLGDLSIGSYIRRGLEKRGCTCSLAASSDDAAELLRRSDFDLIISTTPLEQADPLLSQLIGSQSTIIAYQQPTEDGCCWLPLVNRGTACFGAPALCPIDFIALVDQIIMEFGETTAVGKRKAVQ